MIVLLTKIAYTDFRTKQIPNCFVCLLMLLGVGAVKVFPETGLLERTNGFFVISVLLLLLTFIVPGSIGGGDIKLMAAGGFLLGGYHICDAFVIGILLAGIYVTGLFVLKRIDRKTEIALGPFLCTGMIWILVRI